MTIFYLVFGNKMEYHLQARFSMMSFRAQMTDKDRIVVVTTCPEYYPSHLAPRTSIIPVTDDKIKEWEFKLITYEPTKMKEFEITEQYCRMLEKNIQRQPEFWLWSHNRWKRGREEWLRDHVDQETGRVRA